MIWLWQWHCWIG